MPADAQEAIFWYRKAADQGHVRAQFDLGLRYEHGQACAGSGAGAGVVPPRGEQDYAPAQYMQGVLHDRDDGPAPDSQQACACYCRAAAQGHSLAQFALGLRHDNGQDVPQDYAAAWDWYALAARQGHARAQMNLGLMAASGQGGPLDLQQAYIWLSMAVAAGVAGAEKSLRQTAARMREMDLNQVRQRLAVLAD